MSATEKTILVTAFTPFGGDSVNPAQLALEALPESIAGIKLSKLLLPVEFVVSTRMVKREYEKVCPSAVIMLGQAGGRGAVTPEKYGRNIMEASIPDNAGYKPERSPIYPDSPERFRSTLPLDSIVQSIAELGLPAEISEDAGTFVCNSLLYGVLYYNGGEVPTGFIHVPFMKEQTEGVPGRENSPCWERDDIIRAVEAAVRAVALKL